MGSDQVSRIRQVVILVVAVSAVSSASIIAILSKVPGSAASFWRMTISALVLSLVFFHDNDTKKVDTKGLIIGASAGIMLGVHMSTWLESLAYASVAVSTTIVCTHSLFSSLFSVFLGEPPRKSQIFGIAISLIGVYFLSGADPHTSIKGVVLALIGAISGGIYFTIGRYSRTHLPITTYLVITYSAAAITSLIFALIHGESLIGYSFNSWIYLFLLALIPNIIGHSLLNLSLRYATATTVTGTVLGEPVGATILAIILLNQYPSLEVYLFMSVILLGVGITVKSGLEV